MATKLFSPARLGAYTLKHRVVLAPLTRVRASKEGAVPADFAADYYAQRSTDGGLLISEATFIAREAGGLSQAPGIYTAEQIKAWKHITDAVHAKGGIIFCQLWAHGRVADPNEVSPVWSAGTIPYSGSDAKITPLAEPDIQRFVGHFATAAKNAIEAGFDGVEIHGANGYLIDQFLQSVSNNRTDQYGGSFENRFRFPLQVLKAVSDAIGPERVGIRMSPFTAYQDMREKEPLALFVPWTEAIVQQQPKLAYIHATEARADFREGPGPAEDTLETIRKVVEDAGIAFIAAGGYSPEQAVQHGVETDDLVAFGRHFIANPDLPARIKNGWPLNKYDRNTFYTHGREGYTDYPTYDKATL